MEDRTSQFDHHSNGAPDGYSATVVSGFASVVVSLLAERSIKNAAMSKGPVREEIVESFVTAALSGTERAFDALLAHFRKTRISFAMVTDTYIPEAARRMGDEWMDDQLSWLDVSIGTARLQSLVREISAAWTADQADSHSLGAVLLLVPEGEQHTLGPMVVMGQLRRLGISVCLRINATQRELTNLMDQRQFDGILVSVATETRLHSAAVLIKTMRTLRKKLPPIIIGGPIVLENPSLAASAGADYTCADIATAMEAIGLKLADHQDLKKRA